MTNPVTTYGIASSVALCLLLGLPASAVNKTKPTRKPHTQSRNLDSPTSTFAWVPGKDKIVQPTGISKVVKESNPRKSRSHQQQSTSQRHSASLADCDSK